MVQNKAYLAILTFNTLVLKMCLESEVNYSNFKANTSSLAARFTRAISIGPTILGQCKF